MICKGAFADIVVFNPESVIDTATYTSPLTPAIGIQAPPRSKRDANCVGSPKGIKLVLVNGKIAYDNLDGSVDAIDKVVIQNFNGRHLKHTGLQADTFGSAALEMLDRVFELESKCKQSS